MYGFRVIKLGIIGLLLSGIWLSCIWFMNRDYQADPLALIGLKYSSIIIIGFYVYHGLYGIIKTYLSKIFSYLAFLSALLFFLYLTKQLADDFYFNQYLQALFYLEPPILRTIKITVYLILPILLGIGPIIYAYLSAIITGKLTFRRWFKMGRGGSAIWAGPDVFRRRKMKFKGLYNPDLDLPYIGNPGKSGLQTDQIFLGRTLFDDNYKKQLIGLKDDAHMLTVGTPGSGKTTAVLRHCLATYSGSIFILDIKGEHAETSFRRRSSKEWLRDKGITGVTEKHLPEGQCYALDPFGQLASKGIPSASYNPLSEIDIQDQNARAMLASISDGCVTDKGANEKEQHFIDLAKALIEGVICHVLSTYPKADHNLPFIADKLDGIDPTAGNMANVKAFDLLLADMLTNTAVGGIAQRIAAKLGQMGPRERGSVLSTVSRSTKWMNDPAMRRHLMSSDFKLADFGSKTASRRGLFSSNIPETIYVVISTGQLTEQMRWLRTITGLTIGFLKKSLSQRKIPSLLILDEFARLGGKIKAIEDGMTTLRYAKVKIWPVVQELSQLKQSYPDIWNTFIGPANVQVLGVGTGDNETAEWISKTLGKKIIRKTKGREGLFKGYRRKVIQETIREQLTPAEIMDMLTKTSNLQIILPNNSRPMRLERVTFKNMRVEGDKYKTYHSSALKGHFEDW